MSTIFCYILKKAVKKWKGYRFHNKEELPLIRWCLKREPEIKLHKKTKINTSNLHKWIKQYLHDGEDELENKHKSENFLFKYNKKELIIENQLE